MPRNSIKSIYQETLGMNIEWKTAELQNIYIPDFSQMYL